MRAGGSAFPDVGEPVGVVFYRAVVQFDRVPALQRFAERELHGRAERTAGVAKCVVLAVFAAYVDAVGQVPYERFVDSPPDEVAA